MRARNIKPGFFKNEELASCSYPARILFPGLWCLADREGRLEDRPLRIKAECLPYDDCDTDALLQELADKGFIIRYELDGKRYIAIPAFVDHQNPHCRESPSKIPCPTCSDTCMTTQAVPSTVLGTAKAMPSPADSGFLIPDSNIAPGKPTQAATKKERPRNHLFDAIVKVTGFDPSLKSNGSLIGKVAASLAAANPPYTPEEVLRVPAAVSAGGLDITITPSAIEKYICWVRSPPSRSGKRGPGPPPKPPETREQIEARVALERKRMAEEHATRAYDPEQQARVRELAGKATKTISGDDNG